jgi:hypothetical protein
MRPSDYVAKMFTQTHVETSTDVDKVVLDDAVRAMSKSKPKTPVCNRRGVWRIIMKSRITQFAAAAVIIVIAILSVTVLDKSIPSAYALEQTMRAYESVRFFHIEDFKEGQSESREFWVELDEQEQVKRFRASLPTWDVGFNVKGPSVMVWNEGKLQIWRKNDNVIMTEQADSLAFASELSIIFKESDPRSVVEELHQLEAEGKVEIKISEPALESEPIVITAKPLSQSNGVDQMVLYVDQNTKLVTRVIFNGYQQSREFSDYNIAIDESFFTLSEVPENVHNVKKLKTARYNLTEIGLIQDKLGDNEIAFELARQFMQALIDKDYVKVGKLCGGISADTAGKLEELVNTRTYKKILRIEQPTRDANSSINTLKVPCVAAVKWRGAVLVMRTNISVEPNAADPNRWVVDCNDIDKEWPTMTADPTDTTATFMKNINTKLASLDINKSTADDVIAVLGEPWAYRSRHKDVEEDNLPEVYTMDYPGGVVVSIYKNQVMLWGCQQIPGYEIPGYVLADSIQIGATLGDVFKKLGSPTKVVEGFGEGNKIMYEDNTSYVNMNINERKGFCFFQYDHNGEKIKLYFNDNVLYKGTGKIKGLCLYGTVSNGKRIRILSRDNKVVSLYEYRTEPIGTIE